MQTRLKRACVSAAFAGPSEPYSQARCSLRPPIPKSAPGRSISRNPSDTRFPAPKSATTKIEAAGAGTKVIVDQAPADSPVRHWEFTSNYDGKDMPVTGNNPDADTIARTRVDANTVKSILKKRQGYDHADIRRVERWQDTDGYDDRHERCRSDCEQRRCLRQAVGEGPPEQQRSSSSDGAAGDRIHRLLC